MSPSWLRPTRAVVDSSAIRRNVEVLRTAVAPADVAVVVKADGYGHGALAVARAAVRGGATWLMVATVDEAGDLRAGGVDVPVLVLSRLGPEGLRAAASMGVAVTVDSAEAAGDAAAAAEHVNRSLAVHLKIDTGMHRLGIEPGGAVELAGMIVGSRCLELGGTWTHFARADEPADETTRRQLRSFVDVVARLRSGGIDPGLVHAANSAGALAFASARMDLVRVGLAAYGVVPFPGAAAGLDLRPALQLESEVIAVRRIAAGDGVSYGHRYRATDDEWIATVPIGYADGIRRDCGLRGVEVLIGGRRRAIRGVVTMDQLMVGVDDRVAVGDPVVLIGEQLGEAVSVDEVARRLDTIPYEVLATIGTRVPRVTAGSP